MMALKLQMLKARSRKSQLRKYFGLLQNNVPQRTGRSKTRDKERRSAGRDKSPKKEKTLLQKFGRARNPSQVSMISEDQFADVNTHRSKSGQNKNLKVPTFNPQDKKPRTVFQPQRMQLSRSQVNIKPDDAPYRESYDITKYNKQFNVPRTPLVGQQQKSKYELPAVRERPN